MAVSRSELIRKLSASVETLEQVRELQSMQHDWLDKHPDDEEVLGYGESLKMLELGFKKEPA